jgi:hypothetical protein
MAQVAPNQCRDAKLSTSNFIGLEIDIGFRGARRE